MATAQREPQDMQVLLKQLGNLVTPMVLRVAATLRLVDHIQAGATTVSALADATGADTDSLSRLVRHLLAVGVLAEIGPGRVEPTAVGQLLADDHPAQQRAWLDLTQAVSRADLAFVHLLMSVRTGKPVYQMMYGRPFWEDLSANADLAASFDALMACDEDVIYDAPVAAYDWTGVRHVLDVGGGTGGLLLAIARAASHVRGTLLELAGPAATAQKHIAEAGLTERITVVEGDFFDPLPCTADVIALSYVLLNWSDDEARQILLRCKAALEPGGRVLVLDRVDVPNNESDPFFTTLLDMRMLVFMGGRVRTQEEFSALAAAVGMTIESVVPIKSPTLPFDFSLLTFAPSPASSDTPDQVRCR